MCRLKSYCGQCPDFEPGESLPLCSSHSSVYSLESSSGFSAAGRCVFKSVFGSWGETSLIKGLVKGLPYSLTWVLYFRSCSYCSHFVVYPKGRVTQNSRQQSNGVWLPVHLNTCVNTAHRGHLPGSRFLSFISRTFLCMWAFLEIVNRTKQRSLDAPCLEELGGSLCLSPHWSPRPLGAGHPPFRITSTCGPPV